MLAAIPYTTFPDLDIPGLPFTLRVFGIMVALGILVGARVGAGYAERFGLNREDTYNTGMLMVLAGIIGSRLTWVLTHFDEIENPVDVIAIWRGGIQFSGGFIAALIVGFPMFRSWGTVQRWNILNGYAMGLTVGIAIGRIGCYAVGEHFGRQTNFFLATRYEGGHLQEPMLGDVPIVEGMVFHNTSLYELIHLTILFGLMVFLTQRARRAGREVAPASFVGLFLVWYGVGRFVTDTFRVNDERVLQMTGAQWMSLALVPIGIWILVKLRPEVIKLAGAPAETGTAAGLLADEDEDADEDDTADVPDKLAAPDEEGAQAAEEKAEPADEETDDAAESESESPAEDASAEVEASTGGGKNRGGESTTK